MKSLKIVVAALLITFLGTSFTYAGVNLDDKDSKSVIKARKAAENAAPDDWTTFAQSAALCIRKNTNMKEASQWIDKSLEIQETQYNLEVKGDYYKANKLYKEAVSYYIKSIAAGRNANKNFDTSKLQNKILAIRKK
jgi:hypothetical protein